MGKCQCGSFAINKDPDHKICDVCYAYQDGFAAGQTAEREACAILAEDALTNANKRPIKAARFYEVTEDFCLAAHGIAADIRKRGM